MYGKRLVLEELTKLFSNGPFKSQELKLGLMVLGLSPFQFPAGKGNRVILPIV